LIVLKYVRQKLFFTVQLRSGRNVLGIKIAFREVRVRFKPQAINTTLGNSVKVAHFSGKTTDLATLLICNA